MKWCWMTEHVGKGKLDAKLIGRVCLREIGGGTVGSRSRLAATAVGWLEKAVYRGGPTSAFRLQMTNKTQSFEPQPGPLTD
jgi:hypothetical protein